MRFRLPSLLEFQKRISKSSVIQIIGLHDSSDTRELTFDDVESAVMDSCVFDPNGDFRVENLVSYFLSSCGFY